MDTNGHECALIRNRLTKGNLRVYSCLPRRSPAIAGRRRVNSWLPGFVRFLQRRDVDLVHLHHRGHDALGFRFIRIAEHVAENNRVHLPRETEFVFEPTAWSGRSAVGGKFLPEIIDLVLGFAVD